MLPYIRTIWVDYMAPALKALNLNKIESKLEENTAETISNTSKLGAQQNQINAIVTKSTDNSEVIAARTSIVKSETFASLGARIEDAEGDTGDLINLDTDAKTSVVNSINEVYAESLTPKQMGGGLLINGNFDRWEHGTNVTGVSVYAANKWKGFGDVKQERSTFVPNSDSLYSMKVTSSDTTALKGIRERVEGITSRVLSGKKAAISFWMYADSESVASSPRIEIKHPNLLDDYSGITSIEVIDIASQLIVDTWSKVEIITDAIPVGVQNGLEFDIYHQRLATVAPAIAYISQVKIIPGEIITDFVPKLISDVISDCNRTLRKGSLFRSGNLDTGGTSAAETTSLGNEMRIKPTVTLSNFNFLVNVTSVNILSGLLTNELDSFTHYPDTSVAGDYRYSFDYTADAEL